MYAHFNVGHAHGFLTQNTTNSQFPHHNNMISLQFTWIYIYIYIFAYHLNHLPHKDGDDQKPQPCKLQKIPSRPSKKSLKLWARNNL